MDMKLLKLEKSRIEMNFVSALYKDVDLFYDYEIDTKSLTSYQWRFFYGMLKALLKKKTNSIDEYDLDMYIGTQSQNVQKMYQEFGGWGAIERSWYVTKVENIEQYYSEFIRYNALLNLAQNGFPIFNDWNTISKLSYEALSTYYTDKMDNAFAVSTTEDEISDIKEGSTEMIDEADKGAFQGLPYQSKIIDSVTNGMVKGNITMFAGSSGTGKSYMTLSLLLPTFIQKKEPLVIMCNEEDRKKWQREILTWIANNVIAKQDKTIGMEFIKSRFYQGKFTNQEKTVIYAADKWFQEKVADGLITFVDFKSFSMNKGIKMIKKYARRGVGYFVIDTLKLDNDEGAAVTDNSWLQLQQNMVKLYNAIKSLNVHCWVTFQLSKVKTRYLDQTSLGISKNTADVASTLILMRRVLSVEKSGGKSELKVTRNEEEKPLIPDRDYRVLFIDKNRMGSTNKQIVIETDMGRNIIKDKGFTTVPEDY